MRRYAAPIILILGSALDGRHPHLHAFALMAYDALEARWPAGAFWAGLETFVMENNRRPRRHGGPC